MSYLSQVTTGKKLAPPRAVIYSAPKAGKTTLLASIPDVVIVPLEAGEGVLDFQSMPIPDDWLTLRTMLRELATEDHPYKAVGIDGLSGVELLIWDHVCNDTMKGSWEKFHAFGRGPRQASSLMVDLCRDLDAIRRRGIAIWCAAHAKLEDVDDVDSGAHVRVAPDLHKHALPIVERWADLIGYIEVKSIAVDKGSDDHTKKTRTARSTGERRLLVEEDGSHVIGNRYGLAGPIALPKDNPYGALRSALIESTAKKPQKEVA